MHRVSFTKMSKSKKRIHLRTRVRQVDVNVRLPKKKKMEGFIDLEKIREECRITPVRDHLQLPFLLQLPDTLFRSEERKFK